ncbi:MAG: DUF4238 domain-containing protein [Atopobiaceae bacterium]|nr:DUF4238 domain-containing protein [Atopobiaceae bacterium]
MATKNQHYVPQFYLKGFASEGRAWAVRKDPAGKFGRPFCASVKDLCSKRYYHEVEVTRAGSLGDSVLRGRIERQLSKQEHELADPLREVTSARDVHTLGEAVAKNLDSMKVLLAHMIVRNPMYLDPSRRESEEVSNTLIAKGLFSQEELLALDGLGLTPQELTEHSIMHAVLWSLDVGSPMHSVLEWLGEAGVLVLRAKVEAQFVTADAPFELGWGNAESELPTHVFFPLDWRTAVVFHTYGQGLALRYADAEEVDWWNHSLATRCEDTRMVVAKSERALRNVMREFDGSL